MIKSETILFVPTIKAPQVLKSLADNLNTKINK